MPLLDLTADFETYFDRDYSLTRMTTQEYIEDARFEVMGCSVAEGTQEPIWIDADDLSYYFSRIDWSSTNLIGHNLIFDGAILARYYGYLPKLYSCTLSYARAIMGPLVAKCNLETLAAAFNLHKDTGALTNLLGVHLAEAQLPENSLLWERYKRYACSDVAISRRIYDILLPFMPGPERIVADILIRMFVEGRLELDPELLEKARAEAVALATSKLAAAGVVDKSDLRSRDTFAQMLRNLGVNPPMKISKATGLPTYAFAKNDLPFVELLEHPDDRVSTLVEAKLNASSTIHETRAERLISIARLTPEHRLQVPIAYSGAHTHRFSGLDKLNLQNLPNRGDLRKLRKAIRAPKGWKLVVRDASQIEARLLAYVAGQWDLVKEFADGEDVYVSFALNIYHRAEISKQERFVGKTGILGLGYGSGAATFLHMLLTSQEPIGADYAFAERVVMTYRSRYHKIVNLWYDAQRLLPAIAEGSMSRLGPAFTDFCKLTLPSGQTLQYPGLERVPIDQRVHPEWGEEWHYYKPKYRSFSPIFGAKLVENLIQNLARNQIADTMVRMRVTNPVWHCALQVHDELVYLAPDSEAEECERCLTLYMNAQPAWAAGSETPIPLANEGGIGEVYGDVR